ncbi:MAG: acyl carrier protein [Desulfobacterium sp.]|nr:acyl carrier protein [Desulfobacterium sp.]
MIEDLEKELLDTIIEICDIREAIPEEMSVDTPLIGQDSLLGLDSLDAVEIVVMIQDVYGVRVQGQEQGREIINTLKTLADFIKTESRRDTIN